MSVLNTNITSFEFRLKRQMKQEIIFLQEIKQKDLMKEKHKQEHLSI